MYIVGTVCLLPFLSMYSVIPWLLIVGTNVTTSIPRLNLYDSSQVLLAHLQITLSILFSCLGIFYPFFVSLHIYIVVQNLYKSMCIKS